MHKQRTVMTAKKSENDRGVVVEEEDEEEERLDRIERFERAHVSMVNATTI